MSIITTPVPEPYRFLANIGISSVEEVENINSAEKYVRCRDRRGFGNVEDTLHHTSDGRWFLLTVVDDDTDPSRTLYMWNTLTEEAARKWIETNKPTAAQ